MNVFLLLLRQVNLVRTIVHAARISVQKAIENLAASRFRYFAVQFVIELFQSVLGEGYIQFYSLRRSICATNLVRFGVAEIVGSLSLGGRWPRKNQRIQRNACQSGKKCRSTPHQ